MQHHHVGFVLGGHLKLPVADDQVGVVGNDLLAVALGHGQGFDVGGDYIATYDGSTKQWSAVGNMGNKFVEGTDRKFDKKVTNFFSDIIKMKAVKAAISGGSCIALASRQDSTYNGTYPAGIVTSDTFEDYKGDAKFPDAYSAALTKAGYVEGNSAFTRSGS